MSSDNDKILSVEGLLEYYLSDEKSLPKTSKMIGEQIILWTVSLSGAPLYAIPADDYAVSHYDEDNLALRIYIILSTCIPCIAVLYNSTVYFLEFHRKEEIPSVLSEVLQSPMTANEKLLKKFTLGIGSVLSAVPLAAISVLYPIPGFPEWFRWFQAAVVGIDNALLHFLPIELAFQNPIYRFPFLPFEYTWKCLHHQSLKAKEAEAARYQSIRTLLINVLASAKKALEVDAVTLNFKGLSSRINLPDDLQRQTFIQLSGTKAMEALLKYGAAHRFLESDKSFSLLKHPVTLRTVEMIGSLWLLAGSAGYFAAPINGMQAITGDEVTGLLLSSVSVYFFAVLIAFFGKSALRGLYDYLTQWDNIQAKIPLPLKLNPVFSLFFLLSLVPMSVFTYASAVQLIEDNLGTSLAFARSALVDISMSSLILLCVSAMIDFYCIVSNLQTLHFGKKNDAQWVVELSARIDELMNGIQHVKGQLLAGWVKTLDNDLKQRVLDISDDMLVSESDDEESPLLRAELGPDSIDGLTDDGLTEPLIRLQEENSTMANCWQCFGLFSPGKSKATQDSHGAYHKLAS